MKVERDLFGEVPRSAKETPKAERADRMARRYQEAAAAVPRALAELSGARDAAAPFERAFWSAHRALEEAVASNEITKAQRMAAYDTRLRAGHAWWPFRQAVNNAEAWLNALQVEIKECGGG